jgi:hypothetical protein
VVSSGCLQVVALDARFTSLVESEHEDEDVVFGVLQAVFTGLPRTLYAKNFHEVLLEQGFCSVDALSAVTVEDLVSVGIVPGYARKVINCLRPPRPVDRDVVVAESPIRPAGRSYKAPTFPKLGATNLPTASALKAYMPLVFVALRERGVEFRELQDVYKDPAGDIDPAWDHGGDRDRALWAVLAGAGDGLDARLMLSFPTSVRDGEQGIRAWKHLFERVLLVTDESIAALQVYFDTPPVVRKKGALLGALNDWENIVEELSALGCRPWDPAQRASLGTVFSGVEDARRAAEALAAVHKVVPVAELLEAVRRVAVRLAAVEQQAQHFGMLGEVAKEERKPKGKGGTKGGGKGAGKRTGRCRLWDQGACSFGENCRYTHEGEAGNGFKGHYGNPAIAELTAQVAALQAQLASTLPSTKWCADNENNPFALLSLVEIGPKTPLRSVQCSLADPNESHPSMSNMMGKPGGSCAPTQVSIIQPVKPPVPILDRLVGVITPPVRTPKAPASCRTPPHGDPRVGGKVRDDITIDDNNSISPSSRFGKPTAHSAPGGHIAMAVQGYSTIPGTPHGEGGVSTDDSADVALLSDRGYGVTVKAVFDTGCTTHVMPAKLLDLATNVRHLSTPVRLQTANGNVPVHRIADLYDPDIEIKDALVVDSCERVLISAAQICRESDMGVVIHQGFTGADFVRDGVIVKSLECNGNLIEFPIEAQGGEVYMSDSGLGSNFVSEACMYVTDTMLSEHAMVMMTDVSASLDEGVRVCLLSEASLSQHYLDGHRPSLSTCPWCVQAGMRHKKAIRIAHSDRIDESGFSVSVDLTGPFEPDVDGHKFALVGVELGSSKGHVGLLTDRTAKQCLQSIKQFESDLKQASNDRDTQIVAFHHDDDKSFRGCVEEYALEKGWVHTHTGGYDPNCNSIVERRIGMLHQLFRVLLLCATGGSVYYEQLWGRGLSYASDIIDSMPWPDRESPNSFLAGKEVSPPEDRHVFGAYCLYYIDKDQRSGKWQPAAEMGVWVGLNPDVKGGHFICPIRWDAVDGVWVLGATVYSRTVKVYDDKFPLRMAPKSRAASPENFHTFVDKVCNPLFTGDTLDDVVMSDASSKPLAPRVRSRGGRKSKVEPVDRGVYEVERVRKSRMCKGRKQYLVKWKGYTDKENTWEYLESMSCDELIADFESHVAMTAEIDRKLLQSDEEVDRQASVVFGDGDCHARTAVCRLMSRQCLEGGVDDYLPGYKTEVRNVLKRRMILQNPAAAAQIRESEHVVSLRMLLEHKRNGRKKGRMICQGFKEPVSWDTGSNMSPVAFIDSIRMLILMNGDKSDIISTNDIKVAFLQAHGFDPDDKRYVSYKAYKQAAEHVFELCGPLYGQRVASKQWYRTIAAWLCNRGFEQGKNEPCLFRHPVTGFRIILVVDDLLCRGSVSDTTVFHDMLEGPDGFECSEGSRQILTVENSIDYCGLNLSMKTEDGRIYYCIDQTDGMIEALNGLGLSDQPIKSSPMPNMNLLLSDMTLLNETDTAWCKSALGQLHYYARGCRWDISETVSAISQFCARPNVGTVAAIKYLAGYILGGLQFCIKVERTENPDTFELYSDSNHYGGGRSQTGVLVLLNGAPLHWRSNRQPVTADSPAVSEIYALKEAVKDGKLIMWVAEEMGIDTAYPFTVFVDNTQARSFQSDTCPNSKIRGSIDMRKAWVEEMRDQSVVATQYVDSKDNLADILTKCMAGPKFSEVKQKIVDRYMDVESRGTHVFVS